MPAGIWCAGLTPAFLAGKKVSDKNFDGHIRTIYLTRALTSTSSVLTMETLIAFGECMPKLEPKSVVAS
jgi:hypothetical protein